MEEDYPEGAVPPPLDGPRPDFPELSMMPGMPTPEEAARATGGAAGIPIPLPGGGQVVAVPETPGELTLYERFMQYGEDTRTRMVLLQQRLAEAQASLQGPLFSGEPSDLDGEILDLLDQV
jgi:hypothetical protein